MCIFVSKEIVVYVVENDVVTCGGLFNVWRVGIYPLIERHKC